jgi:hypothetical protein
VGAEQEGWNGTYLGVLKLILVEVQLNRSGMDNVE